MKIFLNCEKLNEEKKRKQKRRKDLRTNFSLEAIDDNFYKPKYPSIQPVILVTIIFITINFRSDF